MRLAEKREREAIPVPTAVSTRLSTPAPIFHKATRMPAVVDDLLKINLSENQTHRLGQPALEPTKASTL
jgi:hypothetical protein